jgi:class I fructose-bisphosphate aldolase
MNLGKTVRLNRLFAHPSRRLCSVAVDHFIGYGLGLPPSLQQMTQTLRAIVAGEPDAVTMHRGIAAAAWEPYAGRIPLILQSTLLRADEADFYQIATVEDAVRLGADALAMVAFMRGASEVRYMKSIADCVSDSARFEMPVIVHIYPMKSKTEPVISYEPEDIAWAVHCALECGVDVIKVPFCNDVEDYRQIVSDCPVPVVAAGGPKTETPLEALQLLQKVVQSGARGAVVGRNVWSAPDITAAVRAIKAVVHDEREPSDALVLS